MTHPHLEGLIRKWKDRAETAKSRGELATFHIAHAYARELEAALALQVGDKGQAVVIAPHAPAKAREDWLYAAGWRQCAMWAGREDLISDIGSHAYEADKAAALATFAEGESLRHVDHPDCNHCYSLWADKQEGEE